MSDIKDFDISQVKIPGNEKTVKEELDHVENTTQEVVEDQKEEKTEVTEEVSEETQEKEDVDNKEEVPEQKETETEEVSNTETSEDTEEESVDEQLEETNSESEEDNDSQKLIETLDNIASMVSNGSVKDIEGLIEDYKSLRDSEKTVFKDDFIKNAVDYYNKTGSLSPYLEATSFDYDKMSDEKVMRHNLEKEHPSLSPRAIEKLYARDVINKYSLDEDKFDVDDVELGKELLKADATKLRAKYKDEQQNFIQPEVKEDDSAKMQQEALDKFATSVESDQNTKDLFDNKRILVEYNDEKFSYEVEDPSSIKDMTLDSNKFFQLFSDENGKIDLEKWYRVATYALDPETYDMSLISHGVGLGQEKVVKDLKNPSKVTKSAPQVKEPESVVEGIMGEFMRGGNNIKIIK